MPDADDSRPVHEPGGQTFHLTPESVWLSQAEAATYQPEPFATEGFIHCTDGEANLISVANRYYQRDPRPHVALVIELERVKVPVPYEEPTRPLSRVADAADIECVAQPVAEQVEAEDGEDDREAREDADPPRLADEVAPLVQR